MTDNKLKGHLGLCRRAGKMSLGHDATVSQIKNKKAHLVILCKDSSERLIKEIEDECTFNNRNIKSIKTELTSDDMYLIIGSKSKVFSIDDLGFANTLLKDLTGGIE